MMGQAPKASVCAMAKLRNASSVNANNNDFMSEIPTHAQ
jgi:hypothetical protein